MKKSIITIIIVAIATIAVAQTARHGSINQNAKYQHYITSLSDTISVGDTLRLGQPSGEDRFLYITQGGVQSAARLASTEVVITKIHSYGRRNQPKRLFVQFKGYGAVPVYILYEAALEAGEVVNPAAPLTRDQAIAKLKEAKDLLDLGVISSSEYETLKDQFAAIIRQ